jgi:metal-responsive CopG/Arc/MetJ family transcriptional regulator
MKDLPRNRIPVSTSIPFNLLAEVDEKSKLKNKSRSEYIVEAIQEKIAREEK